MKRIFCIVIAILVSITIFCGCATKADGEVEKYGSYVNYLRIKEQNKIKDGVKSGYYHISLNN